MGQDAAVATATGDERVARQSLLGKLLGRPELGALTGAVVLFVFFGIVADAFLELNSLATVLYGSSTIGIMAVSVSLLMIGGEFDLSAGVQVTTASLTASMVAYQLSLNVWAGALVSLVVMLAIGLVNGLLYVKTGLPSFIITLGMFLMLTGLNLGVTRLVTGNVASDSITDMDGFDTAEAVFSSDVSVFGLQLDITIFWWLLFVVIATWILIRTRAGNWIYAVGGSAASARAVGVPVARTKIALFMGVGFTSWFLGMHLLFAFNTVQSGEGVGNELIYISAAVIGGCLLTGGYGTAVGAATGAFIFGMANKGIIYAQWSPDWFLFFLGFMLLTATLLNSWIRRRAEVAR
ncbi:MAG: ABC transporter permease [Nocardioidaceae bacterium]